MKNNDKNIVGDKDTKKAKEIVRKTLITIDEDKRYERDRLYVRMAVNAI